MKKYIIPILAITIAFAACKKEDIPAYDSKRPALNFVKNYFLPTLNDNAELDTLRINTVYYTGQDEIDFKIPVRLSGTIADHDRKYTVRISSEKSYGNLVEGVHYTLPTQQILHAGQYADSTIIQANLAKLREDHAIGMLVIELVPDETFIAGLDTHQSIGVEMSGGGFTVQPPFWNRNDLNTYGGTYSSIKAEKYAELNGVTDDMWRESNTITRYAYGKRTYEWFRNNPTYDNGVLVVFKGTINYE